MSSLIINLLVLLPLGVAWYYYCLLPVAYCLLSIVYCLWGRPLRGLWEGARAPKREGHAADVRPGAARQRAWGAHPLREGHRRCRGDCGRLRGLGRHGLGRNYMFSKPKFSSNKEKHKWGKSIKTKTWLVIYLQVSFYTKNLKCSQGRYTHSAISISPTSMGKRRGINSVYISYKPQPKIEWLMCQKLKQQPFEI